MNIKQAVIFVFIPAPRHLIRGLVGSGYESKWFHPNRTPSRRSHHRNISCSRSGCL